MFTEFRTALAKRRAYIRTRNEIAAMPREIAIDLNIDPADASRLAAMVVYGK